MKKFKLLNINIELNRNVGRVESLIEKFKPDFFCAQEISRDLFEMWRDKYFKNGVFSPMVSINSLPYGEWGVAIFSKFNITKSNSLIYDEYKNDYVEFKSSRSERPLATLLSIGCLELGDIQIATTHFTWSASAKSSDEQHNNLDKLIEIIEGYKDLILCGDINSPRGSVIFDRLSISLVDNIPTSWSTTIDPGLHQAGDLNIIVDGLFSKGDIDITDVKQVFGVSDHTPITCNF